MPISTINTNSIADDAVTVPKVTDQVLTHRNLIINGAMQVAQRGTSFGTLSSQAYTLDRWIVDAGATVQQASLSVDEITNDTQLTKAIQMQGASSDYFLTRIEDVTKFSNQTFTLSFYVKGSSATTLNNIYARQAFGSGGSSLVDTALSNVSYSVTTSYTRYTATVTLPSISGKTVGTGSYLELFMLLPDSVTVYITGVQLEVGDTATPFEHRSYGDELARCQRYYEQMSGGGGDMVSSVGQAFTSSSGETAIIYKVEKRAAPAITTSGSFEVWLGTGVSGITSNAFAEVRTTQATWQYGGGAYATTGQAIQFFASGGDATIKIDAEL